MKRRTFLMASIGLLTGCSSPDYGRDDYPGPYEGVRRGRYRKQRRQDSALKEMDTATRHVDSIVRRVRRWNR